MLASYWEKVSHFMFLTFINLLLGTGYDHSFCFCFLKIDSFKAQLFTMTMLNGRCGIILWLFSLWMYSKLYGSIALLVYLKLVPVQVKFSNPSRCLERTKQRKAPEVTTSEKKRDKVQGCRLSFLFFHTHKKEETKKYVIFGY